MNILTTWVLASLSQQLFKSKACDPVKLKLKLPVVIDLEPYMSINS